MAPNTLARLSALLFLTTSCGVSVGDSDPGASTPDAPRAPTPAQFSDVTAVKAEAAAQGWMVLVETLKTQLLVTVPERALLVLDDRLATVRRPDPVDGWTLVDAVGHPSGDLTAVYVRYDAADPFPLRVQLSRHRPDGSRVDTEIAPVPPGDDPASRFIGSLDRARLRASGEGVTLAVRWAGNAVYVHRFAFTGGAFEPEWATRVEPEAHAFVTGIIGGGFDNFHQGDYEIFVYCDVDAAGNSYVAVPSTESVLANHDAAFGEDLSAGADPASFDFGTAILTKLDGQGRRVHASLLGTPGKGKRLLGMRAGADSVLLSGRVKIGSEPDGWDAWLLAASTDSGAPVLERQLDVNQGDMLWEAVPLPGARILAVGSTRYTQNPTGLSVSDGRDALAVVLDARGDVTRRLELPRGVAGRGDEAIGVHAGPDGVLAIAGMTDGPGTHAEVHSNGFVVLVGPFP